ncbi:hypothetical protein MTR_8g466580 [Medicago truncatula]|uniref:Uncharacterized protein n=1 Tax=Medicago truncatula TaxID=3880 RepID=A0A072TS51_MEDTR|nr:hypothetical protein MTR_8g466580 [Medicago truncatula]
MGSGLLDNIFRKVEDGASSLFWMDPWLDCVSLDVRYTRLFDLAVNKFVNVAEMFSLYWEVNGEAWKWGRRLFAWDEGFVRECMAQLLLVVLQVGVTDGWIYKLHSSNRYTIKSAYNYLTRLDVAIDDRCNHVEEPLMTSASDESASDDVSF